MRAIATAALMLILLGACGSGKDRIADRVEEDSNRRAEAMEEASESMTNALQQNIEEQKADLVRRAGHERADAIRQSQLDASKLDAEQKNELVKGQK